MNFFLNAKQDFKNWLDQDPNPWFRVVLLIWTIFAFTWIYNKNIDSYWKYIFFAFDHGIHEIGHWITLPFGLGVSIPAGTIFQIALPCVAAIALWKNKDFYGVAAIPIWHAFTFQNISHYAGSAAYSELEMWTPHFITMYHDWVWMLTRINRLHWAPQIETFFHVLAVSAALLSILAQGYVLTLIFMRKSIP